MDVIVVLVEDVDDPEVVLDQVLQVLQGLRAVVSGAGTIKNIQIKKVVLKWKVKFRKLSLGGGGGSEEGSGK